MKPKKQGGPQLLHPVTNDTMNNPQQWDLAQTRGALWFPEECREDANQKPPNWVVSGN